MARRFYCPQPLNVARLRLSATETHHLLRVLRARVGDEVLLFDGEGLEAVAVIVCLDGEAELEIRQTRSVDEGNREIVLATAVPKGDRFSWLVEKAVELGVSRVQPLRTKRSVVDPGANKLDRMRQVVISASKQCGRTRLMEIAETRDWADFLSEVPEEGVLVLGDPSGEPWSVPEHTHRMILCVGPEGGFTPEEVESALRQGACLVSVGRHILRVETAGLALATLASSR